MGRVFPMVVDTILPQAEFGPNDHRKDALHFTTYYQFNPKPSIKRLNAIQKNVDISGALFLLRIQFKFTQTQCEEGTRDVNINWVTMVIE